VSKSETYHQQVLIARLTLNFLASWFKKAKLRLILRM